MLCVDNIWVQFILFYVHLEHWSTNHKSTYNTRIKHVMLMGKNVAQSTTPAQIHSQNTVCESSEPGNDIDL